MSAEVRDTPVGAALRALGIPHRVFDHPNPPRSLEEAAAARGHRPDQVIRSLLFRSDLGEHLMVLVAGPAQVPWKALRRHLGRQRISLPSAEEVLAITGYPVGAVAPFGLPEPMRVIVDTGVAGKDELSMGSGERGRAIILESVDLLRALAESAPGGPEVVDLLGEAVVE
jgi:Cys-tRNA(Pro) deacylase